MHLALALLLQSSLTVTEPTLPTRDEIVGAYDSAAEFVSEIIGKLPERLGVKVDQPHLGFTMHTEELGIGEHGLPKRHTFVLAVFKDSPAFTAGIRPGDRIVAIGAVQCDTLKPRAVLYYLADHPESVPFTLERNGKISEVTVRRAPLACAAAAWRAFPEVQWRTRMSFLQALIIEKRTLIARKKLTRPQTLQAMSDIGNTATLIDRALAQMSDQLNPAGNPHCTFAQ